ncbi:DUF1707 SHOCT-like domain-containing protein [Streptoalloteichus hindustanus]|uniref:DUF1707 domain-containing protein n=1 Tax=Streptoalloteichus hindustanus TaxID=2017 RepID=A0A1M5L8P7_STRHI|nr:DUF1707 domain-containing protein [Streptoalloteichus hindustanus]SHG61305.1 protein of unknown function [Streptoalloteichus hindustanus]
MEKASDVRASAQERERAIEALGEHVRLQRIDLAEFDTRVAAATAARTRAELTALFDDLPAPHPAFDGGGRELAVRATGGTVARVGRSAGAVAAALYPMAGVLALTLFFVTGSWLWFMIVPPATYAVRQLTGGGARARDTAKPEAETS